jgi:hypothetical protein
MRSNWTRTFLLTTSVLGVAALPSTAFAACPEISFRLWQPTGETWYDGNDVIQIAPGQEGHIYVHVKGRSTPYSTSATIGYPQEFGLAGDAREVERRVRMQAQNNDDRSQGRIRFRTDETGQIQLGYRLSGIASPGTWSNVPDNCRTGAIAIAVGQGFVPGGRDGRGDGRGDDRGGRGGPPGDGRGGPGDGRGGGDRGRGDDRGGRGDWDRDGRGGRGGNTRGQAAENLVEILYEGILRRERAGEIDRGFVTQVERNGFSGLERVAISITASQEFQNEALRRTRALHGRIRNNSELYEALLLDIYGDLYGDGDPSRRDYDRDYRDLSACLSGGRNRSRSCEALGRSLINNPLFEDENVDLLEDVY